MSKKGHAVFQFMSSDGPVVRVTVFEEKRDVLKKTVLLIATLVTVWLTGYWLSTSYIELGKSLGVDFGLFTSNPLILATVYTVSFLGVLAMHEYGHILVSKKYCIPIAGPYFIPAPPAQLGFIGTLGSVISMKNLPPSKRSLVLLGLSGPIAGFLGAIAITWVGILLSMTIPIDKAVQLAEKGEITFFPYTPLILLLLLSIAGVSKNEIVILHPLAFAGFIIFVITFLNLMPIGQLDGGHVVRGFTSPEKHKLIGYLAIVTLVFTGIATYSIGGTIYLFLAGVLLILKLIVGSRIHPGSANMFSRTSEKDYLLLIIYLVLVLMTSPILLIYW